MLVVWLVGEWVGGLLDVWLVCWLVGALFCLFVGWLIGGLLHWWAHLLVVW